MEISEIKDYVSNELEILRNCLESEKKLERVKKIMEDLAEYYVQNSDKKDDISLVQFYNGMMIAYNNVLKTIDDLPRAH